MRPNLAVALALLPTLLVTACGAYGQRLVNREVVVHFTPTSTQAQHDAARAACSGIPHTTPEPAPTSTLASIRSGDVRFQVGSASDAQLSRLYNCLRKQPGVLGVEIPAQM